MAVLQRIFSMFQNRSGSASSVETFFNFLRRNEEELGISQRSSGDTVTYGINGEGIYFEAQVDPEDPTHTIVQISLSTEEKRQIFRQKLIEAYKDEYGHPPMVTMR